MLLASTGEKSINIGLEAGSYASIGGTSRYYRLRGRGYADIGVVQYHTRGRGVEGVTVLGVGVKCISEIEGTTNRRGIATRRRLDALRAKFPTIIKLTTKLTT